MHSFLKMLWNMKSFEYMTRLVNVKICAIQKWYKALYMKKLMATAIINLQWSAIEYEIINGTKKKDILAEPFQLIKRNYLSDRLSLTIPVSVRKKYILRYLNVNTLIRRTRRNSLKTSSIIKVKSSI